MSVVEPEVGAYCSLPIPGEGRYQVDREFYDRVVSKHRALMAEDPSGDYYGRLRALIRSEHQADIEAGTYE
jgi:hypothetical protein